MRLTQVAAFILVVLLPTAALAQGQITGRLTDRSGGLPGATVTAESPALVAGPRAVVTDEDGNYEFTNLPPGTYVLTFLMPGFRTVTRDDLVLGVDEQLSVNAAMHTGWQWQTEIPGVLIPKPLLTFGGPAQLATPHFRLAPGSAGVIQLCKTLPNDTVGSCQPVVAAPRPPNQR